VETSEAVEGDTSWKRVLRIWVLLSRVVWVAGTWNLQPDSNPNNMKQTHTQCWVRIHDLPQEYLRSQQAQALQ